MRLPVLRSQVRKSPQSDVQPSMRSITIIIMLEIE